MLIGAPKIDMNEKERALEARYALDSPAGVRKILRDYHALLERQYKGDYDAVVILNDLQRAVDQAQLTRRQRQAVYYVYVRDLTQSDAGKAIGVAQHSLAGLLARAEAEIAAVFEAWAWQDEGYAIHYDNYGEAE
ncbi:hypothetical protein [Salibacterium aidingense]|uniref:hypothetical protein n=1 Tax=Salibacterium aidingense TaxID=384933 RepID=UPI003BCEBCA4